MTTSKYPVRTPGPQKPSRYPIPVGARYKKYGEQPGFIYNPYQDQYIPDVQGQTAALQGSGVLPADPTAPKAPSLTDSLFPIAATGLAFAAPKAIIDGAPNILSGLGGLFGVGGASGAPAVPEILGSALSPGAVAAPTGLFGFGAGTAGLGSGEAGMLGIGQGGFGGPGLGLLGFNDLLKHNRGPVRGTLQGAASGALAGSHFGPVGTVVGGAAGGLVGLGSSFLNKGYSDLEDQKRAELAAKGIDAGSGDGAWENNSAFKDSRDESQLKGEDIVNAADWQLQFDPARWAATDQARRIEIANEAIKRGLVREHNGGIDINTSGLADFIRPGA